MKKSSLKTFWYVAFLLIGSLTLFRGLTKPDYIQAALGGILVVVAIFNLIWTRLLSKRTAKILDLLITAVLFLTFIVDIYFHGFP